jgi:hypothetical protein
MYGPMSKHKNKPVTKSLGSFFQEKWSKTTRKQVSLLFFTILGDPQTDQMDRQRRASGRDVWPNIEAKNKPLTIIIIMPILSGEMVQNYQKTVFYTVYCIFCGHLGILKQSQKVNSGPQV